MKTTYTQNTKDNELIAERSFAAPKSTVWKYFTTAELLDMWWGPLPYKAITTSMDFTPNGEWRYVMAGPQGDAHHCINTYHEINPEESFTAKDVFANEDWTPNANLPEGEWNVSFAEENGMTTMKVVITFKDTKDLETIVSMGMKEGFNQGLDQLEALFHAK